nr:atherin-like [Aegilops tauschii subsp. strangulata]
MQQRCIELTTTTRVGHLLDPRSGPASTLHTDLGLAHVETLAFVPPRAGRNRAAGRSESRCATWPPPPVPRRSAGARPRPSRPVAAPPHASAPPPRRIASTSAPPRLPRRPARRRPSRHRRSLAPPPHLADAAALAAADAARTPGVLPSGVFSSSRRRAPLPRAPAPPPSRSPARSGSR